MARIFAYIAHKDGVADDSAAELLAAAKKIDRGRLADRRSSPVGARNSTPFAKPCVAPIAKCGRSRTRASLIPMPSSFARRC